jgi:hypothetical protein
MGLVRSTGVVVPAGALAGVGPAGLHARQSGIMGLRRWLMVVSWRSSFVSMAARSGTVPDMKVDAPEEVSDTKLLWRRRLGVRRGEWRRRLD